jgi:DNA-binding GntR family transcriptional regulator
MRTMASTQPRTHGGAGLRIADDLRTAILDGQYAPGARIRQEYLAEYYGASRLPVREALRMLEGEGLVRLVANTGAWVTHLSLADCDEMYQLRERIEPLLLRYNVPLLSEAQIDHLDSLATQMEHGDDVEHFLTLDREFHLGSYEAAKTTLLTDTVDQLWNRTQHYRRAFMQAFRPSDRSVHYEHHLLVAAIRRRDVDEAERILAAHIRRTRFELSRHPEIFAD